MHGGAYMALGCCSRASCSAVHVADIKVFPACGQPMRPDKRVGFDTALTSNPLMVHQQSDGCTNAGLRADALDILLERVAAYQLSLLFIVVRLTIHRIHAWALRQLARTRL